MRPAAAAAVTLLAACQAEYRPPAWDPPPRAAVSVGCVELTAGLMVDGVGKVPGIPLRISFHSTCKEPVLLDVRRVRVLARLALDPDGGPGRWIALNPYDPDKVMHAGLLAPDDGGDEPIEYDAPAGALAAWDAACANFDAVRPDVAPVSGAVICFDREARILEVDAARGAP